jgi:pimeloyl-ACP methyl ester carboxylesterase
MVRRVPWVVEPYASLHAYGSTPIDTLIEGQNPVRRTVFASGAGRSRRIATPRRTIGLVLLGLLAPLTASCGGGGEAKPPSIPQNAGELRHFYEQKISWQPCDDGFQCGRLEVPLDYAVPGGKTIKLAVIRKRTTDQARQIGSLLINPGGPGGSGVEFVRGASDVFTERVRARYDLVGFDPRGVGDSAPIHCLDDKQMDDYVRVDSTPDDEAEVNRLVQVTKEFAEACKAHSGELLGHVSTIEAARDMDVLRGVLGDAKLHYFGFSYGTYLGATYAEQFPDRVGRMVLDGAVDPKVSVQDSSRTQTAGFELALASFLKDCATQPDCPLGADPATARQRLTELLKRADVTPLPGDGTRTVNEALATTGIAQAMYAQSLWPALRSALAQANVGQGKGLLGLADSYNERDPSGHYSNSMAAFPAINCLDSPPAAASVADVEKELPSFRQVSPIFGTSSAWAGLTCAYWPVPPVDKPHEIKAAGTPTILVVGTTRDPATPYSWAQGLATELASGVLLTYDADGHTAYGYGNPCVDDAVDTYLIDDRPPAAGTRCTPSAR